MKQDFINDLNGSRDTDKVVRNPIAYRTNTAYSRFAGLLHSGKAFFLTGAFSIRESSIQKFFRALSYLKQVSSRPKLFLEQHRRPS